LTEAADKTDASRILLDGGKQELGASLLIPEAGGRAGSEKDAFMVAASPMKDEPRVVQPILKRSRISPS
jgi:hypothetical protein